MENRLVAQKTHSAMGTVMTHKAFGPNAEYALEAVCIEIAWLEDRLSRFLPDSDVGRVNRSAGVKREKVGRETYAVLSEALEFARRFPGCFDVTIAPLVALWHTARQSFSQPDASSVQQILPLVNYRDLVLEPRDMTAGLRAVGQSLDLGGIGKGFAGDKILEIFGRFGVTSAYSNLGGNVVTLGAKLDGSPWHIGIQHPRQEQRLIGVVSVADQTVVTSGDYQRYYTDRQGKRHHHILDPRTGYPAESGLISVSVVTEKSLVADVLSTVVFIAGLEKGLECLRNFPQTEAILVDTELQIHVTQGLKHRFQADQGVDVIILN
jgi:thiamine biosynthesis lipoprotein